MRIILAALFLALALTPTSAQHWHGGGGHGWHGGGWHGGGYGYHGGGHWRRGGWHERGYWEAPIYGCSYPMMMAGLCAPY